MNDLESSKAMMTPGIAGSATTMITGTLAGTFGFPGAVTALVVSFVLGLVALGDKTVTIPYKVIFYIINSMTIFTVAVGLNHAGVAIIESDKPESTIERTVTPDDKQQLNDALEDSQQFFQDWF